LAVRSSSPIDNLRRAAGLRQDELAAAVGVSVGDASTVLLPASEPRRLELPF
jgi:hypothetical protein